MFFFYLSKPTTINSMLCQYLTDYFGLFPKVQSGFAQIEHFTIEMPDKFLMKKLLEFIGGIKIFKRWPLLTL